MKKISIIIAWIILITLSSAMLRSTNDNLPEDTLFLNGTYPKFYSGTITIKVKEGIKDFGKQKVNVSFNIPSLDSKVLKYEIDLLEKRFIFNPKKMKKGKSDLSRIYRIEFSEEFSVSKVAREFSEDPNIEYAEPIPIPQLFVEPNDPMYGNQQYLSQIMADSAWSIHKGEDGEEEVVIAIVDSGIEWDHEDLVDNVWQNNGEDIDGDGKTIEFNGIEWIFDPDDENGIDDDENGYIDDFIGWNFYLENNDPSPVPGGFMWDHGTLMGGYASATTNNNIGIASVSWNLKILPVQSGWDSPMLHAYSAIIYAAENGADVISNSWGYYDWFSQSHYEAITYARELGSIIVGGTANDDQFRLMYPAAYPGVLGVAALDNTDNKANYSNYGPHIAISAPGGEAGSLLITTNVNNSYTSAAGTSCATPIVAGLLGLVKSYHPEWTSDQVITQVLGTADTIDYMNPGYENQLGAGRINAFRALDTLGVNLQQEIALDLMHLDFQDNDNNHIPEPGDTVKLNLKLINYNFGVEAINSSFTLSTSDPDIEILENSFIADIPADDYFELSNAFKFVISESASTHEISFDLQTSANKEITWGENIDLELLVAPAGILVYQGEGNGNAYSGDLINEYLVNQGFEVFYTNKFPASLIGFDAAFLSFGNHGQRLRDGTAISMAMSQSIMEYLYQGGNLYIECGSFYSTHYYFDYPNLAEIMDLMGLDQAQFLTYTNNISLLTGLDESICQDLEFSGSTQNLNWYIDEMVPNEQGIAAFEEVGYGKVAVHSEGEYGQKTFCFSYALAHLEDGLQGTRDDLISRIVDFFFPGTGVENYPADNDIIDIKVSPNPFDNKLNVQFELKNEKRITFEIFEIAGKRIALVCEKQFQPGKHSIEYNSKVLQKGIYILKLKAGNNEAVAKVVKKY